MSSDATFSLHSFTFFLAQTIIAIFLKLFLVSFPTGYVLLRPILLRPSSARAPIFLCVRCVCWVHKKDNYNFYYNYLFSFSFSATLRRTPCPGPPVRWTSLRRTPCPPAPDPLPQTPSAPDPPPPKMSRFFPSPLPFSFFFFLWGSYRGILVGFLKDGTLKCARLESRAVV